MTDRSAVQHLPPDVLVIAGDVAQRRALVRAIEGEGSGRARVADTLSAGLAMIATAPPALVIVDLHLPDSDGLATLHALGAVAEGVPVVVLTGDAYTAEIAVAAGADDAIVTSEGIATALGPIHRAIERADPSRRVDLGRFFHTADGLFVVFDAEGAVVRSNPAFSRRLGWSPARLRDLPADRRFHAEDLDAVRAALVRAAQGGTETLRARHGTDDGFWRDIDWSLTGDAATGLVYAVGTDITDAVRTVRALESSAQTDHLTGLANRLGILTRLGERVAGQVETAVLYCDLDGFKAVNDAHGHAHGDQVLVAAAGRLATRVRANDLAGRIGGDEFVVVTTPGRGAEQLAARLIEGFVRPISIDGFHAHLGLSVGIAMAPAGSRDVDAVLGAADRAMYQAKQAGGGTWRLAEDR